MAKLLFFYFATVILGSGLLVIFLRNIVYSALALLVAFIHIAGLYVLLNAEFIAAIQVIVYGGAVLVLYLFVVMLFNIKRDEPFYRGNLAVALFIGLVILGEVLLAISGTRAYGAPGQLIQATGNTEAIGLVLYTQYLLPFEVASFILLVAMIGAIILAKQR